MSNYIKGQEVTFKDPNHDDLLVPCRIMKVMGDRVKLIPLRSGMVRWEEAEVFDKFIIDRGIN